MSTFDIAGEVLERESRERQALALLLDGVLARADRMFVQRTKMGGTEAYLGSVELNWVSANIGLAQELPFLAQYIDEDTGQMVIDAETIDLLTQRPIDWSRQQVLAQYIATTKNHKFPPLLVVITAPWVNDPDAPEWGADGRAVRTVTQFTPLENSRRVGLLDIGGSFNAFALDGQHRLIGIQGFINLVRHGQLEVKNKQNKSLNKIVLLDELITEYGLDRAEVQSRAEERVGVEFIPAVVVGETIDEARRRVKDIFTHVNMTAAPLNAGQIAQLDEGNGFAIVARRNAVSHDLLRKKEGTGRSS